MRLFQIITFVFENLIQPSSLLVYYISCFYFQMSVIYQKVSDLIEWVDKNGGKLIIF